jgi:hypothetical protein
MNSDENTNNLVSYRVNSVKQKTNMVKARIHEIMKIVEQANPALYRQLSVGKSATAQNTVQLTR